MGRFGALRPDLPFWVRLSDEDKRKEVWKYFIVEFAIPFGRKVEDEYKNSLEKMKIFKTNKYAPRLNFSEKNLTKWVMSERNTWLNLEPL
jgi:hypothetical protein